VVVILWGGPGVLTPSLFGSVGVQMCMDPPTFSAVLLYSMVLFGWRHSVVVSGVDLINEVNRHWARLVLGWVTVCGRVNHLGM